MPRVNRQRFGRGPPAIGITDEQTLPTGAATQFQSDFAS